MFFSPERKQERQLRKLTRSLDKQYFETVCDEIDLNAEQIVSSSRVYQPFVDVEICPDDDAPDKVMMKVWLRTRDENKTDYLRRHWLDPEEFRPSPMMEQAAFRFLGAIARFYRQYKLSAVITGKGNGSFGMNLRIDLRKKKNRSDRRFAE